MLKSHGPVLLSVFALGFAAVACGQITTATNASDDLTEAALGKGKGNAPGTTANPNATDADGDGRGPVCGVNSVIGNLAHGQTVCNQRNTVPVNVKGAFGRNATLTITGPAMMPSTVTAAPTMPVAMAKIAAVRITVR